MGPGVRLTLARFVYGLAVWALLLLTLIPVWEAIGLGEARVQAFAFEGLVGHLLLGALIALIVDLEPTLDHVDDPVEESGRPARR